MEVMTIDISTSLRQTIVALNPIKGKEAIDHDWMMIE